MDREGYQVKNYIKFELSFEFIKPEYVNSNEDESPDNLYALFYLLNEIEPDEIIECLEDFECGIIQKELVFYTQEEDVIRIYSSLHGGIDIPVCTLNVQNFKKIIQSWKKFRDEKVPEIYFIQEDDETIIVRESLEG